MPKNKWKPSAPARGGGPIVNTSGPKDPLPVMAPSVATAGVAPAAASARREQLIDELESERGSRVVCFATSDRGNQETQIGQDVLPVIFEHLAAIGHVPKLDLLVYSRGGDTLTSFSLANALREFGDRVAVLVPFRAQSGATLIALAADEIVMGPFGQLSPIDPSITSPHGPTFEQEGKKAFIPVSVEDVANFFELARKEAGLEKEEHLASVLGYLAERVNPLALGAVYRAREQIGMLAEKLLSLHITDKGRRDRIVKTLTRELLSHDYVISRTEAREIGLAVVDASDEVAPRIWGVYETLAQEMKLGEFFRPDPAQPTVTSIRAVVQSRSRKHLFESTYRVTKVQVVDKDTGRRQEMPSLDVLTEGWRTA